MSKQQNNNNAANNNAVRPMTVKSFARGVLRTSTLADQEKMLRAGLDVDDVKYCYSGNKNISMGGNNVNNNYSMCTSNSNRTNTGSAFLPAFSRELLSASEKKSKNINIRRKVLSPRTAAIPENRVRSTSNTQEEKEAFFFHSGIMHDELIDAALHGPVYKTKFTVTGRTQEFKDPKTLKDPMLGKQVELNGKTLALFRHGLQVYAMEDKCCHQGAKLHRAREILIEDIEELGSSCSTETKRGLCVICPAHHYRFDLDTGRCLHHEGYAQQVFPCKVDGDTGEVLIGFRNFSKDQFEGDLDFNT
eukprot:CAMPEP_0204824888 /NCGR_PEP_ID=MMETSP1346-20131115/2871_1 /ASSEMBLY_ACC=CAM_ASM_000771 /TAXON_ID=215587 /ORGANISM="Aplanochytrium stocchinoi, Strain GSBS06" /LENGTH=303 /DNA_ID=CAMNT_0051952297 /DNA_START=467 /DNA_END=1376 /DNA_ORIENTATION=+